MVIPNGTAPASKSYIKRKMLKTSNKSLFKTKKRGGFTLVEVLISFSIIMLLVLGIAQLITYSIFIKRKSDLSLKSAELAAAKLEYLKSLPFESQELIEGQNEEKIKEEKPNGIYRREWDIQNISDHLKKIEIECFAQAYPRKKIRLVLFLSKQLDF